MKIRIKLLVPSILSLLLFMLVLNLYWLPNYLDVQKAKYRRYYQHELHLLGMALAKPVLSGDMRQIRRLLDRLLQKNRNWKGIVLQDAGGRRLYPLLPVRSGYSEHGIRILSRVEHLGKPVARLMLNVDLREQLAMDAGYINGLNNILWAVLLLAVISSVLLQERVVVRPVKRLVGLARQVAGGVFDVQFDCHRRDEIGILTGSFRDLCKDLEQALLVFRLEAEKERAVSAELKAKNRFIESVNRIQQEFIAGQDVRRLYDEILNQCLSLTGNTIGLVSEVVVKDNGVPVLNVMSRACQDKEAKNEVGVHDERSVSCKGLQKLAESVMHSAAPAVALSESGLGMAAVPLFGNREMVGVLCLGGRDGGYDKSCFAEYRVVFQTVGMLMEADLNRRKGCQAQQALQKNEQELRLIVDNVIDGIVTVDGKGMIQSVNPAAEKMFGYPAAKMKGSSVEMLIPARHVENHARLMSDYFEDPQKSILNIEREVTGRRSDGSEFSMSLAVRRACDGDKELFVAIVRDITERKEYERKIAYERDRARHYLEAAEVILIAVDTEGLITMMNRKGCEILGYEESEVTGNDFFRTLFPAEVAEELCSDYRRVIGGRAELLEYYECKVQAKSGEVRTVVWRNKLLYNREDTVAGMLVSGEDVTELRQSELERKQLRNQLHQAQKMDAIGKLTGGIAHDFNNMLASVLGYSELALEVMEGEDYSRMKKYLQEIHTAGERARDLVSKMLTFSRGSESPKPVPIALAPLIDDVMSMLRAVIPATVEIVTEKHDGVPLVLMDTIELQQVVMNLCINARDAMQGSGRLLISLAYEKGIDAACTSCHQQAQGDFVVLSVRDSGSGIDEEMLDELFKPFFSTKEVGKGTGMGLSVVHGIVHARRGHILVDGRPGQGAEFRMLFRPAAKAARQHSPGAGMAAAEVLYQHSGSEKQAPAAVQAAGLPGPGGRIMVVDDEAAVGKFLTEYLRSQAYHVEQYTSVLDALQVYSDDPEGFGVILSDYSMPEMNGLEFYHNLKSLDRNVQMIICTGFSEQFDQQAAIDAGMAGYLPKPVDTQILMELVEKLMSDDRPLGRATAG